jgi:hypothetical protein
MIKKDAMLSIMLVLLALIGYSLIYNFICPEVDFYDFHVFECEYCHSINKTFSLCSGFCFEPREDDNDNKPCAISPLEDCKKNIAHGSNLGTRRCLWQ